MRAILGSVLVLGMLAVSQPASACAMDGMFGAHRFNPFLGMDLGAGADNSDDNNGPYSAWNQEDPDDVTVDDIESAEDDPDTSVFDPEDFGRE